MLHEQLLQPELVVLPEIGHCPMQSHPDITNEIGLNWLMKHKDAQTAGGNL